MLRSLLSLVFFLWVAAFLIHSGREAPLIDLGTVRYPAGTGPAATAVHDWVEAGLGAHHRVVYAHDLDAVADLEADHLDLGRRLGFDWIDEQTFRWQMPPRCIDREWTCIYSSVHARSEPDLEPLLERLRSGFEAERWTATEAARWLLAFVQQIPYRLPTRHAFGVVPPARVVSQDWGDCDSKSLLLIRLLERVGIDAVLLVSEAHAHALVGVAVPAQGGGFRHRGREYAWAETTAPNAPLGWLHPRMRLPDDWRVVPIR